MGCDIHLHVEHRNAGGTWERAEAMVDSQWEPGTKERERWYHGRDYDLFGILADVRNAGFTPIGERRGLPADVSAEVAKESEDWGVDGHSHSWFTVKDLLAYDWQQTTKQSWLMNDVTPRYPDGGAVGAAQRYADFFHEVPPGTELCRVVSGPGADKYKRIEWEQPYYLAVSKDWWGCVARMTHLALTSSGDLLNVRAVFWFDN